MLNPNSDFQHEFTATLFETDELEFKKYGIKKPSLINNFLACRFDWKEMILMVVYLVTIIPYTTYQLIHHGLAMTPPEFDLLIKRLIGLGAPKDSWPRSLTLNGSKGVFMEVAESIFFISLHDGYQQVAFHNLFMYPPRWIWIVFSYLDLHKKIEHDVFIPLQKVYEKIIIYRPFLTSFLDLLGLPLHEVVVLLVLLVWWLDLPDYRSSPFEVLEFFAGVGRIAGISKYCGYTSAAVDLDYGRYITGSLGSRSPMDINSDAGLVLLICNMFYFVLYLICCLKKFTN